MGLEVGPKMNDFLRKIELDGMERDMPRPAYKKHFNGAKVDVLPDAEKEDWGLVAREPFEEAADLAGNRLGEDYFEEDRTNDQEKSVSNDSRPKEVDIDDEIFMNKDEPSATEEYSAEDELDQEKDTEKQVSKKISAEDRARISKTKK